MSNANAVTIGLLRRLANDLECYASGQQPGVEDFDAAPTLLDWRLSYRPALALHGAIDDHPVLLGARNIMTSELYYLSPDRTWARTFSRVYRLNTPRSASTN